MVPTTILLHGCRKCQRHTAVIIEFFIHVLACYFDVKFNNKTTRGSRIDEKVSGIKEIPASFQTNMGLGHLLPLTICMTVYQLQSHDSHVTVT